ncbi:MAG: protein RarD [Deltaproteobacteria bacterium]|nr:protein RarD [Deltaproteobacteria bacterium]
MPGPAASSARRASHGSASGIGFAAACYLSWGVVPIYWKAPSVVAIPSFEVLIPRILWTFALLVVVAHASGRLAEIWPDARREWGWTLAAALLLALNWTVFIFAVQTDRILATSLGYYINPLMSVLLGLLVLGERLNRAQAAAIAIAAGGVAVMTLRAGKLPWISLVLATSFALYGLIHKLRPQPPLGGLLREMLVLVPLTAGVLGLLAASGSSKLFTAPMTTQAYLSLTGVVTAVPLLLFHAATRRLPLVAVGMFQYIAPTITLGIATALYGESFTSNHAMGFGLVWLGLILFTLDSLRRSRQARPAPAIGKAES